MQLEQLRNDIALKQKKGLPFILSSVILWGLITLVCALDLPVQTQNLLVFCCACPLLPLSCLVGKWIGVDIFSKENPLGRLGFLFTLNQLLYLLIVMWVFAAVPEKMVMVHAMVFGAHLLPYSWLYRSKAYAVFAVALPPAALLLGLFAGRLFVACALTAAELLFALTLFAEPKRLRARGNEPA